VEDTNTSKMQLTANFHLSEFIESVFFDAESQKKVIELYNTNAEVRQNILKLAKQLQVLRNHTGKAIHINIAFRPLFWELKQRRSGRSKHVKGLAADLKVKGMTSNQVFNEIEKLISLGKMMQGGLSAYSTFVHYDIRGTRARW